MSEEISGKFAETFKNLNSNKEDSWASWNVRVARSCGGEVDIRAWFVGG